MKKTKQELAQQIFHSMVRQSCTTPSGRAVAATADVIALEQFLRACANNIAQCTTEDTGEE